MNQRPPSHNSQSISHAQSSPSSIDEQLGRLAIDLESAGDPQAVIRAYLQDHPQHAEEMRHFVATERFVRATGPAPATGHLPIGKKLGPFTIRRFLVAGGMGEIYEAEQSDLKRSVALKVIRPDHAGERATQRFHREREVLARLHQTHIVPVFAAGEEDGLEYVAMHLIEGASLSHVVQALRETAGDKSSTPRSLAEVAKAVADRSRERVERQRGTTIEASHATTPSHAPANLVETDDPHDRGSSPKIHLTLDYFRSVAEALIQAAEAVQTAHDRGVCHRDLKPSNMMIEPSGQCWLIDFGLATQPSHVARADDPNTPTEPGLTQHWLGTPEYMAPEQFELRGDPRLWDVHALGASLYELIWLERPWNPTSSREESEARKILAPGELARSVPADLRAICLKALDRVPERRYSSPSALGDDLRRWLDVKHTKARPDWRTLRPIRLWAWRHKAWAALILLALLATGAVFSAQRSELAERRKREQEVTRGSLIAEATHLRMGARRPVGWRKETLQRIEGARTIRNDDELRTHAVATFAGFDAIEARNGKDESTAFVAFDATGKRLLIGPAGCEGTSPPARTTRIWNTESGEVEKAMSRCLFGPVAFRTDGKAVQFSWPSSESKSIQIWDVEQDASIDEIPFPDGTQVRQSASLPIPLTIAITPMASHIALAVRDADGADAVLVWEAGKKEPIATIAAAADVLALSDDARMLAVGNEAGETSVWKIENGERIARMSDDSGAVTGLAFGERPRIRRGQAAPHDGRGETLLAIGNSSGKIAVWNVFKEMPEMLLNGTDLEVFVLRFASGGQFLLSAGRGNARLWDLTTGQQLMEMPTGNYVTDAAMSPDAARVAFASPKTPYDGGYCHVYDLENGRAIRSLHGLESRAQRSQFSADGKRLAALSQTWQLGVWDTATGRLELLVDVPRGVYADHTALSFTGNGEKIVVASGERAIEWSIAERRQTDAWVLNPGFVNLLAVTAEGKLLVARVETKDGTVAPNRRTLPDNPVRCRVWELAPGGEKKPVSEIGDFSSQVFQMFMAPDGRHIVIEGYNDPSQGGKPHIIASYDCITGERLWSPAVATGRQHGLVGLDPTGKFLAYSPPSASPTLDILEMPRGVKRSTSELLVTGLGPLAKRTFTLPNGIDRHPRVELRRLGESEPFVVLDRGVGIQGLSMGFDRTDRYFAWGVDGGVVRVADLHELRDELKKLGMAWE